MKKLGIFALLLALSCSWILAQTYTLTISGTVTETGTGIPVGSHPVDIGIDSSLFGFSYYNTVTTNASGVYTDAITIPGSVSQGTGWAGTRDCTPAGYPINNFTFSAGTSAINNLDFQICTNAGSNCQSNFSVSNAAGSMLATFSDMSSGGGVAVNSWAWDFGDGGSSSLQNPSHTYGNNGLYVVCLTIGTVNGCTSTFCDSLMINGNGGINCNASLTASTSPAGVTTFAASGSGTGSPVFYSYDFGDGNSSTTASATETHTYAASGTYNACVTIMFSDSCVATSCTSVTVSGAGQPCQAGYYWYPDSTGQYSIILVNTSTGTNLTYNWTFGDGSSSTAAYPSHTYAGPGTYVVCVTVTQQNIGCTSTYCDSLLVLNKVNAPFSINVVASGATAIAPNLEASNVSIYPNPARDFIQIKLDLDQNAHVAVKLFDLSGRVVSEIEGSDLAAGSQALRMNTSELPAGLYLARVSVNGKTRTQKVMIAN